MAGNAPKALAITALVVTFLASSFMLSTWPSLGSPGVDAGDIANFEADSAGSTQVNLVVRLVREIDGRSEPVQGIAVKVDRIRLDNSTDEIEELSITTFTNNRGISRILLPLGEFRVSVDVFEIGKQKILELNGTSRQVFLEWIFHKRSINPELMTFLDQYGNPAQNEPSETFRVSYTSMNLGQGFERLGFGASDGDEIELTMVTFSSRQQTDHLVLRADVPIDISRIGHSTDASIIAYWVTTREVIR